MTSKQNKYLFTVTHFNGDADRVAAPLVLANNALAAGGDVVVWVTLEGVMLAKQGAADGVIPKSFPPVADLLKAFKENGGRIGVCPPCAKTHGVTQENMLANAEFMGGAAVIGAAQDRQAFTF
ncbi:MAG TPA: DsrE family protein [Burkholderiales bacterium]